MVKDIVFFDKVAKEFSDLKYGNLNRESVSYLNEENVFTALFDDFINNPYPHLDETANEINYLMELQEQAINKPTWNKYKKFMEFCDEDMEVVFKKEFNKLGIVYKEQYLTKIQDKLGGLIMRLKKYYNRPRPYQCAYYTKQPDFHNFNTISGNHPSYPSGHASQSLFVCKVVAFHNPDKKEELMRLAHRIGKTREVMGVHFPSDTKFANQIIKSLCQNKTIRDIYFNIRNTKPE